MNALNLDKLNLVSPYTVWCKDEGEYGFKTDFDVFFRIYFSPDQTIWHQGAYEFGIMNENRKASPNDKNVRDTIFCIIEAFFESNPDILLYQCETGDNKQALRDRLFLRWFNEYGNHGLYYIKVSKIVAEKIDNYAAIIVQRTNPKLEKIIADFDNFIGFFQTKPQ